jgi:hypothetical protein
VFLGVIGYALCVMRYVYTHYLRPKNQTKRIGFTLAHASPFGEHLAVVGGLSAWVWHCKGVGGFPAV